MSEPIFDYWCRIIVPSVWTRPRCSTLCSLNKPGIKPLKYLKTTHKEFPVGEVKLSDEEMATKLGIAPDAPTTRTSLMGMMALEEALTEARLNRHDRESNNVAFVSEPPSAAWKSEQYYNDFLANDSRKCLHRHSRLRVMHGNDRRPFRRFLRHHPSPRLVHLRQMR